MSNLSGEASTGEKKLPGNHFFRQPIVRMVILFVGITVSCFVFYKSSYSSFQFLPNPFRFSSSTSDHQVKFDVELDKVLRNASMADKTVILTTLNQAWAKPNAVVDVFMESFKIGNGTKKLLDHLVIVSVDQKAHNLCLSIHPHCYALKTEGINFTGEAHFMSQIYLELMWRRIDFLTTVLEMGYNFVFTDADIVWLQNPFPQFYPDGDFQIACDGYIGKPDDRNNRPNGGFNYVKSNNRSIKFYKFWYSSRSSYPGLHDQDVLNRIKYHPFIDTIGLKMKFLDTKYFGGFCEPSKDFNAVCTMHANCCIGMEKKIYDLKLVLEDWKSFRSSPQGMQLGSSPSWRAPKKCK